MKTLKRRVAISLSGGYVPGLNAVLTGAVLAAAELGWEVVGIRDGFEGLLFPERYPDGGVVELGRQIVEHLPSAAGAVIGTAARSDPFHVRIVNAENQVEEVDRSDELLKAIEARRIDGVISVVGSRALSIIWKLNRRGLKTICVPQSVENDMTTTALSFGFNSALSFATEILDRARQAADAARKIVVVEVLGEHAGWLALQSGVAVCADAVLMPEIPYNIQTVALKLRERLKSGRNSALVVVAEGARPAKRPEPDVKPPSLDPIKAMLSPGASGDEESYVIERSGQAAQSVAIQLQRLTDQETYPLVLGHLVRGGPPTAVDRQLGLGYGAAAIRALNDNRSDAMISFQPPDLKLVPLVEAINRVRTVPADSEFARIARSLGICLGN